MNIRYYLDTRRSKNGELAPLKFAISSNGKTTYLNTNIKLKEEHWDARQQLVVKHPQRLSLNAYLHDQFISLNREILTIPNYRNLTCFEIKSYLDKSNVHQPRENGFTGIFRHFISLKNTDGTKEVYNGTLNRLYAYDKNADLLTCEDITVTWLTMFEKFLARTATRNSRNIHLRNIRAVLNYAIDEGITQNYPFRRFKIKAEETPHRTLTVEELRTLFNYPVQDHQRKYLDIFKLQFYLCGISITDLCHLKHSDITRDGRVCYYRAKTGKLYSIKIEPEALEIINKYEGKNYLLNILDTYKNHDDFARHLNRELKQIGEVRIGVRGKKFYTPLFPFLTSYYSRHTWATLAAELDIPKETIAAALGHSNKSVTDIYIRFNHKKVDDANRKVIDYVFSN